MQQSCKNRQETVNKRLKQFGMLKQRYRYDINMHAEVFRACAVLTQLAIDDGDKLFECGYNSFSGEDSDGKIDDGTS